MPIIFKSFSHVGKLGATFSLGVFISKEKVVEEGFILTVRWFFLL